MQAASNHTSVITEVSMEKEPKGLTEIGGFTVCANGLAGHPGKPRYPIRREDVEVAKDFFNNCRRTRWARKEVSPSATILRDLVTEWAGDRCDDFSGVSVGAIVVAAFELGIPCLSEGERDALIGVNFDDVRELVPAKFPAASKAEDDPWKKIRREVGLETEIKFMDAMAPPPRREYAVPDRIPSRQVTLFSGAGGIGKTIAALQLACATVLARPWLGSQPVAGPVIYLGAEDEEDELRRRLHDIAAHYDEPFSELIENGLHASSYAGQDMTLARFDGDGTVEPTPLYSALWEQACGVRPVMIILDTLSDIFDGDENNRGQVSEFVGLLRRLALAANCAVIVNAHPSQSGSNSGNGTSGSTAWHGKVRGRMYMRAANKDEGGDPDLRVLEFMKNQYGALAPKAMLRYQNGVFVPEMPGGSLDPKVLGQRAEETFMALLDRFTREGRNVADKKGTTYAPACFAKEKEATSEKLNKKVLADAMLRLFEGGKIRVVTEGPPSKQRSRIVAT